MLKTGNSSSHKGRFYSDIAEHVSTEICQATFEEMAMQWILEQEDILKPNSINKYIFLLERHIFPEIGALKISEINSEKIRRFITDKSESGRINHEGGLANSTVSEMLVLIKSILGYIEEKYGIAVNIGKIKIPLKKQQADRFYSSKDINILIMEAWRRFGLDNSDLRCLGVLLCIYTGVRISEICALRWQDMDLKHGTIFINNSLQRIKKSKADKKTDLILTAPKTETSIRVVPIKSDILDALQKIQQAYSSKDFILSGKSDKPIEPRNMQYYFKKMQLSAGIEPLCFHSLRHTFASVCIQSGMDVKTLSEILGHSNVNTTLSYYVHSSIEQKLKQIESLSY